MHSLSSREGDVRPTARVHQKNPGKSVKWAGVLAGRSRAGRLSKQWEQNCRARAASAGMVTRRRSGAAARQPSKWRLAAAAAYELALALAVAAVLAGPSICRPGIRTLSMTWITVGQPACG